MSADDNIHYLLGQLEEADYWISFHAKQRSSYARKRLAHAKQARKEVISKIKKLANDAIIFLPQKRE